MNIFKSVDGNKWGIDKKVLLMMIYRALIRSVLDYGCQPFLKKKKPYNFKSTREGKNPHIMNKDISEFMHEKWGQICLVYTDGSKDDNMDRVRTAFCFSSFWSPEI